MIINDDVMSVLGVLKGFYKEERNSIGFVVGRVPDEREAYLNKVREGKSFVRCEMELDKEFEFKREEVYYGEVKEQTIAEMFANIIDVNDIVVSKSVKLKVKEKKKSKIELIEELEDFTELF